MLLGASEDAADLALEAVHSVHVEGLVVAPVQVHAGWIKGLPRQQLHSRKKTRSRAAKIV